MGSCDVYIVFIVVATLICLATNAQDNGVGATKIDNRSTDDGNYGFLDVEICVPQTLHSFELTFVSIDI